MKKSARKGSCATTTRSLDTGLEIIKRKLSTSRKRLLHKKQLNVAKQEKQAFIITSNVLDNETLYIDSKIFQHLSFQENIPKKTIYIDDNSTQEATSKHESVLLQMSVLGNMIKDVLKEVLFVLCLANKVFSKESYYLRFENRV
jgi:hypothetical protein